MVSLEPIQSTSKCVVDPISSPRISFSAEFLDENNFISICPNRHQENEQETGSERAARNAAEFEFLSGNLTNMITADELFCEGKLLPFWQMHYAEKLNKISLKTEDHGGEGREKTEQKNKEESRISWFLDDDPSPRPPKCTVLWKELLRLKKQRASTLSPSSSSSSSSSSGRSIAEIPAGDHERKEGVQGSREKAVKRVKKGLERTRSATIRIRPMINVPICTQGRNSALPPLFSLRKGRLES
ncbi:uncharacterized protein LOC105156981 [Sesamum indicum]|uniref:Uncharacterized protein LOC105156981 n=1 Tax=Sesamum indicum TaxID=4182 RepID=A0A6I9SND2_SESIN|nr:uncharacterized protein LOC105156981 [Sesamum indicum]